MKSGGSRNPFRHFDYTVRVVIIDPFEREVGDADIAPTLPSFQKNFAGKCSCPRRYRPASGQEGQDEPRARSDLSP
jgi:hypothetical protein